MVMKVIRYASMMKKKFTWGILKSLSRLATWIDVTLEAAPTTPEITLFLISGLDPSLHFTASSSMFVIDPAKKKEKNCERS